MKVKEIIQLLSNLNPELDVFTGDVESDYPVGIHPIYPAKKRYFFSSSSNIDGYNVWGDWEKTTSSENVKRHRVEVEITDYTPLHYILVSY